MLPQMMNVPGGHLVEGSCAPSISTLIIIFTFTFGHTECFDLENSSFYWSASFNGMSSLLGVRFI